MSKYFQCQMDSNDKMNKIWVRLLFEICIDMYSVLLGHQFTCSFLLGFPNEQVEIVIKQFIILVENVEITKYFIQ